MDEFIVPVDFHNRSLAELLVNDGAVNANRFQFGFDVVRRLFLLRGRSNRNRFHRLRLNNGQFFCLNAIRDIFL